MAEPVISFPRTIVLNGIDYFLLQLDRIMLHNSGQRNICTFVVELQGRLEHRSLEQQLSARPAYRWITALRIPRTGLFSLCKWELDERANAPEIKQHQLEQIDDVSALVCTLSIDVETQSPFRIDLLQTATGHSMLLFCWHHALMDAHGGERFIHHLGVATPTRQSNWVEQVPVQLPLRQRAMIAYEMKNFVYQQSALPLISLYQRTSAPITLRYRLLRFNQQQTEMIAQRARSHGAGFLLSAFYLAATARCVAGIARLREASVADMLVPVPLDQRRRGAQGTGIGNQVSFLFYRIPSKALTGLQVCTMELVKQMTALMRADNPNKYRLMMDFLRRVPGPVYRFLLKSPTSGLMGSFFFSDTGDSLQDYQQLFKQPVYNAVHYPPNVYPPGITFVYSRFHGDLQITIGYMQQMVAEHELQQLVSDLYADLLGEQAHSI